MSSTPPRVPSLTYCNRRQLEWLRVAISIKRSTSKRIFCANFYLTVLAKLTKHKLISKRLCDKICVIWKRTECILSAQGMLAASWNARIYKRTKLRITPLPLTPRVTGSLKHKLKTKNVKSSHITLTSGRRSEFTSEISCLAATTGKWNSWE